MKEGPDLFYNKRTSIKRGRGRFYRRGLREYLNIYRKKGKKGFPTPTKRRRSGLKAGEHYDLLLLTAARDG